MKPSQQPLGHLRKDLSASLVVFLVALPLCLGIALASGAPLLSGLLAGVVGGIVVGALSGSALGVSGPAAGLAVIVATAITDLGSFDIFLVAVIVAGLVQVVLGFAGAGVVAYYLPSSVITGMLSGIGLIIFLKQIPHAFGYDRDPIGELSYNQPDGETTFTEFGHLLDSVSFGPVVITVISLAILLFWGTTWVKDRKALAMVPGPLLAVVVGTCLQLLFRGHPQLEVDGEHLVRIPVLSGNEGLSNLFTFPDFSGFGNLEVYKAALVLAIVGSLETLLSVEAADKLDPWRRVTPASRELKAQGVGNMVAGFIGGLPITQVIVRSSANVQSGAYSKISTISHGVLLAISVVFLTGLLNHIPLATLAAILLVIGYKLAKPSIFRGMYRQGMGQFIPFLVTVVGLVFTDLLVGIALGLQAAVLAVLYQSYQLPFQIKTLNPQGEERVRILLAQQVTFLNKASVLKTLAAIPKNSTVEIDASSSFAIHPDVVEIIDNFVIGSRQKGIAVEVIGLDAHRADRASAGMDIDIGRN